MDINHNNARVPSLGTRCKHVDDSVEASICDTIPDPEKTYFADLFISMLNMSIFIILRATRLLGLRTFFTGVLSSILQRTFLLIAETQLKQNVVFWRHKMWLNISNQECL